MKNVGVLNYSLTVKGLPGILTNRKSQAFYKPIEVHSVTNDIGDIISSIKCGIL